MVFLTKLLCGARIAAQAKKELRKVFVVGVGMTKVFPIQLVTLILKFLVILFKLPPFKEIINSLKTHTSFQKIPTYLNLLPVIFVLLYSLKSQVQE